MVVNQSLSSGSEDPLGEKMQVDKFYLSTLLSGYFFIFFIAAIQIGVIVQVCYTPLAQLAQ